MPLRSWHAEVDDGGAALTGAGEGDDGLLSAGLPLPVVTPPRLWFHLALVVPAAVLIWADGLPGGASVLVWIFCGLALAVLGTAWATRLLSWSVARRQERAVGTGTWFVVAPLLAVGLAVALVSGVALEVRFGDARSDLDRLVADAPPAGPDQVIPFEAAPWVGTYRVDDAVRVGDAVVVTIASPLSGGLADLDAGFVHVPGAPPTAELFEAQASGVVDLEHLVDDWYAWSSGW